MTERQQNPFTTTFSKKPTNTYIEREELNEIFDTFMTRGRFVCHKKNK